MRSSAGEAADPDTPPSLEVRFRVPAAMLGAILAHLDAALPNEGVGLIGVSPRQPDLAEVFFPGTNVDFLPDRYTMDPAEVLAALRAMTDQGLRLGAIVHSHPSSAPTPSATDRREAYYDDIVMMIVQCTPSPPKYRAWRVSRCGRNIQLAEVEVVVETDRGQHQ